jgi:hypothetical protein
VITIAAGCWTSSCDDGVVTGDDDAYAYC